MKVKECIDFVDRVKPNAFEFGDKVRWLNEVEGQVQTQVLLFAHAEIIQYDPERDVEAELLAAPPHDKLYPAYLITMIDFHNGEYDKYADTYEMFNRHFREFAAWFADNYRPADMRPFRGAPSDMV